MMTLKWLSSKPDTIPTTTSWYLSELGEARGKQELFTRQSPQKLNALAEDKTPDGKKREKESGNIHLNR